ncbi:MAG: methyl-accepting chemotaxis protein [Candidatus Eisenbacteria bacterium]|nr:methyl-accepting chemotaxis protein [Candidatus Eisenbacteria bacterium]
MEEALKKRLILFAFVPLVIVPLVLVGTLWFATGWYPSSLWVASKGWETKVVLGALAVAVAFIVVELLVLLYVARVAGRGVRCLLKVAESTKLPESGLPGPLKEDVEFNVLARRVEQLSRGNKDQAAVSRRLSHLEEELARIGNSVEEVLIGSPFVPLPESEGATERLVSLINRMLPEFSELRKASVKEMRTVEKDLGETREASQQLAAHAERSFLESTEVLVAAREVSRLVAEAREKLHAIAGKSEEKPGAKLQKESIRDAVTRVVETAARGIEELSKGLMKASALSRSSERIANRASVLALNVAVEAARASLPGMNVLAEEIRRLAEFARGCSDDSAVIVKEIETKVDAVVRAIHISQEEVRIKTRTLGFGPDEQAQESGEADAELERITSRLDDTVGKLLSKVQELSRLTEKASREAERVSRKAVAVHDQTKALAEGESWKSPSTMAEPSRIETLSNDDFLIGD